MTDYQALISDAETAAKNIADNVSAITGAKNGPNHRLAVLVSNLAAALRECAPPDGWAWTAAKRGDQAHVSECSGWTAWLKSGDAVENEKGGYLFPTAAAAIAAIEAES